MATSKIRKQVEFYFSDSNFRRDKFLQNKAAEDAQGFVPIDTLLTFNRLRSLTTQAEEVAKAMLESDTVAVSTDMTKLRRKEPLPSADESRASMVYLKGFPLDITIEELEKWGPNGQVARYVRRHLPGAKDKPKPSIFLEMKTPAAAAALVEQHKKEPLTFRGEPLTTVMLRDDYFRQKNEAVRGKKGKKQSRKIREEDLMAGFVRHKTPNAIVKMRGLPEDTDGDAMDAALRKLADVKFIELLEKEPDAAIVRCASEGAASLIVRTCEELGKLKEAGKPLDSQPEGGAALDADKLAARKALVEACGGIVPAATILAGEEEDTYWTTVWDLQARRYRGGVLKKLKLTERDVIPAGTPAEPESTASSSSSSSSSGSEAAQATESATPAAQDGPTKRPADEPAAADAEAASSSSSAPSAESADGEAAAKRSKTEEG